MLRTALIKTLAAHHLCRLVASPVHHTQTRKKQAPSKQWLSGRHCGFPALWSLRFACSSPSLSATFSCSGCRTMSATFNLTDARSAERTRHSTLHCSMWAALSEVSWRAWSLIAQAPEPWRVSSCCSLALLPCGCFACTEVIASPASFCY